MDISREYIAEVVPQGAPPDSEIAGDVREAAARLDDPVSRRSLLWTAAIFKQIRGGLPLMLGPKVVGPMIRNVVVGVLDPKTEGGGFGIALHVELGARPTEGLGPISFPQIGRAFPVVVRSLWDELHMPAPNRHPVGGMSTAWGESRQPRQWGILTAKHCTNGFAVGATMPLLGGSGTVVAKAQYIVDAAFVDAGVTKPSHAPLLATAKSIAAGSTLTIEGNQPVPCTVIGVNDTFGIVNDPTLPVHIFMDRHASPGDSGARVVDGQGNVVGIYMGLCHGAVHQGQSNLTIGRAQSIEQAATILNLTLYD